MAGYYERIEKELIAWQGFEATCREDYDMACQKVKELTAKLAAHKCGACGRGDPTNGSFLGFHAHDRVYTGEVCDDCAHVHGCQCCPSVAAYAWRAFMVDIGILDNMDEERQYE